MELAWIGFFYLLRPGEFSFTHDNYPLLCRNISICVGIRKLDIFACPETELLKATTSAITFDNQKNRNKGEIIAHALSGDAVMCPTRSLVRRIIALRHAGAGPETPLCAYTTTRQGFFHYVTSTMIAAFLRQVSGGVPLCGLDMQNIQTRGLRSGGAMALLAAKVDTDLIRLVGRWRSDAMFRYLHARSIPVVCGLAETMLDHGSFTLAPGATTPTTVDPLLDAYPE